MGMARPAEYHLMFHNPEADALLTPDEQEIARAPLRGLEALIALGNERGDWEISDPASAALGLFATLHGLLSLHLAGRLSPEPSAEPLAVYGLWAEQWLAGVPPAPSGGLPSMSTTQRTLWLAMTAMCLLFAPMAAEFYWITVSEQTPTYAKVMAAAVSQDYAMGPTSGHAVMTPYWQSMPRFNQIVLGVHAVWRPSRWSSAPFSFCHRFVSDVPGSTVDSATPTLGRAFPRCSWPLSTCPSRRWTRSTAARPSLWASGASPSSPPSPSAPVSFTSFAAKCRRTGPSWCSTSARC